MKQPREAKTDTRSAELQKTFGAPMGRKHIMHPMAKTRNEVRCPASGTVNWLTSAFHLDGQCLVCLRSRAEPNKPNVSAIGAGSVVSRYACGPFLF